MYYSAIKPFPPGFIFNGSVLLEEDFNENDLLP